MGRASAARCSRRTSATSARAAFSTACGLTDVSLKGSQSILPRAERIANGLGLDVRVPLFDRALAEFSFRLAAVAQAARRSEKYVLKLAMQGRLPEAVVWRRKFGMSVPMTDWLLGPKPERGATSTARGGPRAAAR